MQEPRVDCPNNSDAIDNIESVTFDTYKEIKAVLKKHRGTAASKTTSLSDWEKWYKIKRIIFPPERYLSFPDPKHPCRSIAVYYVASPGSFAPLSLLVSQSPTTDIWPSLPGSREQPGRSINS